LLSREDFNRAPNFQRTYPTRYRSTVLPVHHILSKPSCRSRCAYCTTVHPGPFVLNRSDRTLEMPPSKEPTKTILGRDPPRQERLNGVSYQQNAIISYRGWQYAVFYTSKSIEDPQGPLLVSLSRRRKVVGTAAVWETLTLPDYEQVIDDSHNTISLGICPGDGTIHLSFDHHADR
jgi:BNR repeat-containing family member